MISDSQPSRNVSASTSEQHIGEGTYVDWAAILAGSVFALALSFLLIAFGASLGLSLTSPYRGEGVSAAWLATATGIWFAWVMVTGFGAGGYLAGRMRHKAGDATADEVEVRDGTHGLMVWATGALVGMTISATGIGGVVSASTSAVATAADTAAEAVSSDYFANVMLRSAVQNPGTGANANDTPPSPTAGDADAATASVRQSEQQTPEFFGVYPAVQKEIASIIARSAANGKMAERDRSYLAQLVAANSDLDQEAARARVDEVNAEIADARNAALAAVEKSRVAGVVLGFIAAATLLIGAIAAFFAAAAGGRHRDAGLGLDIFAARS